MRRIVTFVGVLALCASLAACGSSSPSAPPSAKSLRASIIAAALAQKSVHWTETDRPQTAAATSFVADVTADSGMQRVTFAPGTSNAATATIVLVNHTLYVEGDAAGLENALALSTTQAAKYAGQWIAIPKGDTLYSGTADGLTLASIVRDAIPHGKLKVVRTTSALVLRTAARVLGASVSVEPSGDPLPIAFSSSNCIGCSTDGRFSKWNEAVHVRAPASSTPIAVVRRSS